MASILRVNTLTDASSNNSVPMATVNQGTAKAWLKMDGSGTAEINDSFNNSSIADTGTGQYTITINSAFATANYCTNGSHNLSTSNLAISDFTTTVHKTFSRNDAATFADPDHVSTSNFGDLA